MQRIVCTRQKKGGRIEEIKQLRINKLDTTMKWKYISTRMVRMKTTETKYWQGSGPDAVRLVTGAHVCDPSSWEAKAGD